MHVSHTYTKYFIVSFSKKEGADFGNFLKEHKMGKGVSKGGEPI